ncbi:MAG: TonB-dependent receptor, partial [Rhodospirillaceae bacterium]|nr:TonB-dependent receptor [Rhodospirillaceae bacterium]
MGASDFWGALRAAACLAALAALAPAVPAAAQEGALGSEAPAPAGRSVAPGVTEYIEGSAARTVYDRDFFAPYAPVNARDMVEQIPGVTAVGAAGFRQEKEERRGLRSNTDQVLINGKRVTGKEGDSSGMLERIGARQVLRIEVIVGNVAEIDADVGARVINVVIDETMAGSGSYGIGLIELSSGNTRPVVSLNYGQTIGRMSLNLAAEARPAMQPATVTERFTSPAGAAVGGIDELRDREGRLYSGRALFGFDFDGGRTLQLSALANHNPTDFYDTQRPFVIGPGGAAVQTAAILDHTEGRTTSYEFSADAVVPFGRGHKFLGLLVLNDKTVSERSEIVNVAGANPLQTGGDSRREKGAEKILRGTVQLSVAGRDEVEFGVEGARNTLDKNLDFFSIVGGRRVDIALFNSDQVVSEDRVEPFASFRWRPAEGLEIEPGLAGEFSWLDQVGSDVDERRTFRFAKPSLNVFYSLGPQTRVYASLVRDVGQLKFEDFAATVNRDDDEILGGNPFLAPEKSWDTTVGLDYKLADGKGSIGAQGFYRRITDVLDRVTLAGGRTGAGNLGRGTHYGAKLDYSLKFAKFGLPDINASSSLTWQDSSVTDPFSGLKRRIAKQPRIVWTNQVRHNVAAWRLAYGFEYNKNGATVESDIDKFDRRTTYGDMRLFAEYAAGRDYVIRVFYTNALEGK